MVDNQSPEIFGQTPSQTVGPYFHYGLPWKGCADLVGVSEMGARTDLFPAENYKLNVSTAREAVIGDVIEIFGLVTDGAGTPVPDCLIEIWQADAAGIYNTTGDPRWAKSNHDGFPGYGRCATSAEGFYRFRTIMPGRVPSPDGGLQAAHIAISVFGRGMLKRLATRMYFDGGEGNDQDIVLNAVPAERRDTIIARRDEGDSWRMDIVLRGDNETAFFDI